MAKYELTHTSTDHKNNGLNSISYSSVMLAGNTAVEPNRIYNFKAGVYETENEAEIKELDSYITRSQVPEFEKVEE